MRERIALEFPRFRNSRLRVIRRGHALVVDADGGWIFKFVWHPLSNLKSEIAILQRLRGRLGVPIPHPEFVAADGTFFGYRKINGSVWSPASVRRLGAAGRRRLASHLARLCIRIQRAVPPRARGSAAVPVRMDRPSVVRWNARQFGRLFASSPRLVRAARRVFGEYAAFRTRRAASHTAVGFDLQLDNLLLDRRGRLVGVVDFGYLSRSDPSGVFGLLWKDDPELAWLAMEQLGRLTHRPLDLRQAELEGRYSVFSYLIELATNRWDMKWRRAEILAIADGVSARMGDDGER